MKINKNGFKILEVQDNANYASSGTSGFGYIEHRGLTFIIEDYKGQKLELHGYLSYSSKGYANLQLLKDTQYYPEANGRTRPHYNQYIKAVNDYHNKYVNINRLNKFLSGRVVNSRAALIRWFKNEKYFNDFEDSKII